MFLTELELIGFKSFLRQRFVFDKGTTIFIGPNGCGKSNISDAIRWVLGEQNPTKLRCKSMSDLIFHGTEKKRPVGMAEVSITFDNKKEILPIEFDSVKLTRRLFSSGESEYLINGRKCRLKDITSLLLNTGLGVGGYSVLEQTNVEAILQRPEERLSLFEEAAGISGFKMKIAEAQANLKKTEENISRVKEILREIGSQAQSLKSQAKKAEQYKKIKERLGLLKLTLAQKKYQLLIEGLNREKERYSSQKREEGLSKNKISKLEELLKREREALAEKRERLSKERASLASIKREQAIKREALARAEESVVYLEKAISEMEKRRQEAAERKHQIEREIIEVEKEREEILSTIKVNEERVVILKERLSALSEERRAIARKEEEAKIELIDSENQRIEVSNIITRRKGEIATLSHLKERLHKDLSSVKKGLERVSLLRKSFLERKKALSEAIEEKKEELESIKKEEAELILEIKKLSDKIERLMREEEQHSFKLSALPKDPSKIPPAIQKPSLSLLADSLDFPKELAVALESVLGRRITAILVKERRELEEMLAAVKEKGLERITFLLANEGDGVKRELPKGDGIVGRLSEMVKSEIKGVSKLLSNILVVSDVEAGIKYSQEGFRCVTYTGEVIEEGVVVEAGSVERGYLRAKILRKELEEALSSIRKRREELLSVKREKESLACKIQKEILDRERELKREREGFQNLESKERRLKEEEWRLRERSSSREAEIKEIEEREKAIKEELAVLLQSEAEKRKETEKIEEILERIREDWREVSAKEREAEEDLRRCEAEIRRSFEREKDLANFRQSWQRERERLSLEENESLKDEEKMREEKELLCREIEELRASLFVLQSKEREEEKERLERECTSLEEAIVKIEEERKSLSLILDNQREALLKREVEIASCQTKLASLVESYGEEVKSPPLMEVGEDEIKEEEERLKRIGEVNLLAISEYEKIMERFNSYKEELEDVNKAKADLHRLIRELKKRESEMFRETFVKIKENFSRIFLETFGGGEADLVLQDGRIEIYAQLKGKKSSDLRLLSSGERSLVGLCLLLALFTVRPAPFCFLDEVESSLDESNLERFLSLLLSLSKDTQFLLITHNKRSIEVGNSIYGITMAEPGISSALSLKLSK